jgi:hypothetical protein
MKATLVFLITITLSYCSIFSQAAGDYRSIATGSWNALTTWETFNGVSWIAPGTTPTSANGVVTIQAGHTVTQNVPGLSIDQLVIDGTLQTGTTAATASFTLANGPGVDMIINGSFFDVLTTGVLTFAGTWQFGPTGTLRKTSQSASNSWQLAYDSGASTMPATANWIVRKTSATNVPLSTTPLGPGIGAYYPNLIIENNVAGTWVTPVGSSFPATATTAYPVIKGNLDIGGTGTSTVDFLNGQLYTGGNSTLVQGNVIVRAGNSLRNFGNGLEIQGNLTVNGTITYAGGTGTRNLIFSGANAQTLINSGTLGIYNFQMNKSANTLTLNNPITIDNLATFTNGIVISSAVNLFILNTSASVAGANNLSFVNGPVRRLGPTGITFPVGKAISYRPIAIGNGPIVAPVNIYTIDFNSGVPGWTMNQVMGPEGTDANFFTVSANEGGTQSTFPPATAGITPNAGSPTSCGLVNANATLHVTSVFNPGGGAAYDAGGLCGIFFCPQANRQCSTPSINTTGFAGLELLFDYIENGQTTLDNASVYYSTNAGGSWTLLDDMPKTATACGGQGVWVTRTLALPASCDNITTLRIAFRWINNDDGAGSDPSFAVDNVIVRQAAPTAIFTAEYFPSNPQVPYGNVLVPTLTALSDCEYWILDRTAGTDSRIVTLSWNAASCYNTAFASFEVARWDNISGIWQDHDGIVAGTAAGGTVTTPAVVTSFSPFAIAYVPLPLPVEMENISITCDDGTGVLKWTTASEINNDHFSIERSIDAMNWQEINRVPGAGNSNTELSYSWVDLDPINNGYYRLKQVDYDGKFKIYDPLHLSCISKQNWINLYPNPSTGTINIEISSGSHLEAIMIYSSLGQFHSNVVMNSIQGKSILPVDVSFLEPGMYYLRMLVNGEWITKPVVIIQ